MGPRTEFAAKLKLLTDDLLLMGNMVEQSIDKAILALQQQDQQLAQQVIAEDDRIDQMELDIEASCLTLIARQQPMANDLRKIATGLKIITDLERIADHAQDIAKIAIKIGTEPLIKPLIDIPKMAAKSSAMVNNALDSFIEEDVEKAYRVAAEDDEIDKLHNQNFQGLLPYMMKSPGNIRQATYLLFVSSYLERIGDHATNLAEWIIYMVTGERKELNS